VKTIVGSCLLKAPKVVGTWLKVKKSPYQNNMEHGNKRQLQNSNSPSCFNTTSSYAFFPILNYYSKREVLHGE